MTVRPLRHHAQPTHSLLPRTADDDAAVPHLTAALPLPHHRHALVSRNAAGLGRHDRDDAGPIQSPQPVTAFTPITHTHIVTAPSQLPDSTSPTAATSPDTVTLAPTSLSQSILYDWLRDFYRQHALQAYTTSLQTTDWDVNSTAGADTQHTVPSYITNNCYIAYHYVQLYVAYLQDVCTSAETSSEPHYILHLGAGSGKFAYYFLHFLDELPAHIYPPAVQHALLHTKYVMTDISDTIIQQYQQHPQSQQYIANGQLVFSTFDCSTATAQHELQLSSGVTLGSATPINTPLFVIASYLLDSLPMNAYVYDQPSNRYSELHVGVQRSAEAVDAGQRLRSCSVSLHKVNHKRKHSKQHMHSIDQQVLGHWQATPLAATEHSPQSLTLLPTAALQLMRELRSWTTQSVTWLVTDKGHYRRYSSPTTSHLPLIRHGGSFSLPVNFDALQTYTQHTGSGHTLHCQREDAPLKFAMYTLTSQHGIEPSSPPQLPMLTTTFNNLASGLSPYDWFLLNAHSASSLKLRTRDSAGTMQQLIAYVKLSHYDPDTLLHLKPVLLRCLQASNKTSPSVISTLLQTLTTVAAHIYQSPTIDYYFELGGIYFAMQQYNTALPYYQLSTEQYGEHYSTLYNEALCYIKLKQYEQASDKLKGCLKLDASYEPASEALQFVVQKLHGAISSSTSATSRSSTPISIQIVEVSQQSGGGVAPADAPADDAASRRSNRLKPKLKKKTKHDKRMVG